MSSKDNNVIDKSKQSLIIGKKLFPSETQNTPNFSK